MTLSNENSKLHPSCTGDKNLIESLSLIGWGLKGSYDSSCNTENLNDDIRFDCFSKDWCFQQSLMEGPFVKLKLPYDHRSDRKAARKPLLDTP